jgi:hypothetical protein
MWDSRMLYPTVGIEDDRVGSIEDGILDRPTVANDLALQAWGGCLKDTGNQSAAGIVLMRTIAVTGFTSNQDHRFLRLGFIGQDLTQK